jgi:hypothetical protein
MQSPSSKKHLGHVLELMLLVIVFVCLGLLVRSLGSFKATTSSTSPSVEIISTTLPTPPEVGDVIPRITATLVHVSPPPTPIIDPAYPLPLVSTVLAQTPVPPSPAPTIDPEPVGNATITLPPPRYLPPPTPQPGDPYTMEVDQQLDRSIEAISGLPVILIGTVKDIQPARWTTLNGERPADPFEDNNAYTIYTPVNIVVDQYLKGQQEPFLLTVVALGGRVGADSVIYSPEGIYHFAVGEKVVVFLERNPFGLSTNGSPLLAVAERYTIMPDGQATNGIRTLPLQQLVKEIGVGITADSE